MKLVEVDNPGFGGKIGPAHRRVIVAVGVHIIVLFLRVASEDAGSARDIVVDPDVFLPPVVGQARRGNVAYGAIIRQRDQSIHHRRCVGINSDSMAWEWQSRCRVNR